MPGSAMANNPENGAQNVDNEDIVVTDCLRNPLVLRIILEHFPSPELLQLSLVNKQWKYEARSVMRKRGHLTAYVKSHDLDTFHPRGEVEAFLSDLQRMNSVPFSGISMELYSEFHFGPFQIASLNPLQAAVLAQPSLLKTFSVQLLGTWLNNISSPAVLLTKKLLQYSSGVLEELELLMGYGREDFLEQVIRDFTFPRLKSLKLRDNYYASDEAGYVSYIKALLSRAPNLKMLHTNCPINLMLSVLQGSSVVPVYTSRGVAPFDEISENVISAIGLEDMKLVYTGPEFNFERFYRITPMLLQASHTTTLRSMRLDAMLAVPLMRYGICLKNVKYVNMDINYMYLERTWPRILSVVKDFDFTRIFPNVNKVEVVASDSPTYVSLNHMHEVMEQANVAPTEPLPDRAANIKAMYLDQWNLSSEAAQFFAEMFPFIEKLEIKTAAAAYEKISFESIWKNWLDLKELKVEGHLLPTAGNLDSIFLGIFPEEVAELREKDEEYLKRVNIVPVLPAVTCLKNLRTLVLNHKDPRNVPLGDDATFLFSNLTALLAFARRPALAVSLKVSTYTRYTFPPAMTHLKPYVSITSDELFEVEWDDG